jgi:transposase-like protein
MALRGMGVDILGPFPKAVGGYEYLYVAIDKFTKWPEALAVKNIDKNSTVNFLRGIISQFGVPSRIITDNGTQFTNALFEAYCEDMGIKVCCASSHHPRATPRPKGPMPRSTGGSRLRPSKT